MSIEYMAGGILLVCGVICLMCAVMCGRKYRLFAQHGVWVTGRLVRCGRYRHHMQDGPVVCCTGEDGREMTVHAQHPRPDRLRKHVGEQVDMVYTRQPFLGAERISAFVLTETSGAPWRVYRMTAVCLTAAACAAAAAAAALFL